MDVLYEVNDVTEELELEMANNMKEQLFILQQIESELVWGSLKDKEEENFALRTQVLRLNRTLQHYLEKNNALVSEKNVFQEKVAKLEFELEESERKVELLTIENAELMQFQEQDAVNGTAEQQEEIRVFLDMRAQETEQLKDAQDKIVEKDEIVMQLTKRVEALEKEREVLEFVLNQHNKTEREYMQLRLFCAQALEELEGTKLRLKVTEWREKAQAEHFADTKEVLEVMTSVVNKKETRITKLISEKQKVEEALAKLAFFAVLAKLLHEQAMNRSFTEKENQILQLKFDLADMEEGKKDMTEKLQGDVATFAEQIDSLQKMAEISEGENADLVGRIESLQKDLNESKGLVADLRGQLSDSKQISTSEALSDLTEEIQDLKYDNEELRKVISRHESNCAALSEQKHRLEEDLTISENLKENLCLELSFLKQELARKVEEMQTLHLKLREEFARKAEEIQNLRLKLREENVEKQEKILLLKSKFGEELARKAEEIQNLRLKLKEENPTKRTPFGKGKGKGKGKKVPAPSRNRAKQSRNNSCTFPEEEIGSGASDDLSLGITETDLPWMFGFAEP